MLEDVSFILNSRAKWLVLDLLFRSEEALSTRDLESLSDLNVRSVQLALKELYQQKVVQRQKIKNKILYKPNNKHNYYKILLSLYTFLEKEELRHFSKNYDKKAKQALDFCDQAFSFQNKIELK